jgi:hypothetical protein
LMVRDEAGLRLGPEAAARRWIRDGDLRFLRAGRQIRIDESDLLPCLCRQDCVSGDDLFRSASRFRPPRRCGAGKLSRVEAVGYSGNSALSLSSRGWRSGTVPTRSYVTRKSESREVAQSALPEAWTTAEANYCRFSHVQSYARFAASLILGLCSLARRVMRRCRRASMTSG